MEGFVELMLGWREGELMLGWRRLLAKTERSQWLRAATDDIGRLHAVTEINRLIQVETGEVMMLQDGDGRKSAAPGWEGRMSATT